MLATAAEYRSAFQADFHKVRAVASADRAAGVARCFCCNEPRAEDQLGQCMACGVRTCGLRSCTGQCMCDLLGRLEEASA
jgi:hypothetical protein